VNACQYPYLENVTFKSASVQVRLLSSLSIPAWFSLELPHDVLNTIAGPVEQGAFCPFGQQKGDTKSTKF